MTHTRKVLKLYLNIFNKVLAVGIVYIDSYVIIVYYVTKRH